MASVTIKEKTNDFYHIKTNETAPLTIKQYHKQSQMQMANSEKLWRTRAKVAFPMYKALLEIDRKRHPTEK